MNLEELITQALYEHRIDQRWYGFDCRCGEEYENFRVAVAHQAKAVTEALGLGDTQTEYAIRWESDEMIGPIGPNEANDSMQYQSPANPKTLLTRTVMYTPWKESTDG